MDHTQPFFQPQPNMSLPPPNAMLTVQNSHMQVLHSADQQVHHVHHHYHSKHGPYIPPTLETIERGKKCIKIFGVISLLMQIATVLFHLASGNGFYFIITFPAYYVIATVYLLTVLTSKSLNEQKDIMMKRSKLHITIFVLTILFSIANFITMIVNVNSKSFFSSTLNIGIVPMTFFSIILNLILTCFSFGYFSQLKAYLASQQLIQSNPRSDMPGNFNAMYQPPPQVIQQQPVLPMGFAPQPGMYQPQIVVPPNVQMAPNFQINSEQVVAQGIPINQNYNPPQMQYNYQQMTYAAPKVVDDTFTPQTIN